MACPNCGCPCGKQPCPTCGYPDSPLEANAGSAPVVGVSILARPTLDRLALRIDLKQRP